MIDIKSRKDFLVVVRSNGERTTDLVRLALEMQGVPQEDTYLLSEKPLFRATKKMFELAITSGKTWLISIDSDVVPTQKFVSQLISYAEAADSNFIEGHGYVLDKFFDMPRCVGNRIYRVASLPQIMSELDNVTTEIRPEAALMRFARSQGMTSNNIPMIVGYHDYNQFYRDIIRTAMQYSEKHSDYMAYLAHVWKKKIRDTTDADFFFALKGCGEKENTAISSNLDLCAIFGYEFAEKKAIASAEAVQIIQDCDHIPRKYFWASFGIDLFFRSYDKYRRLVMSFKGIV